MKRMIIIAALLIGTAVCAQAKQPTLKHTKSGTVVYTATRAIPTWAGIPTRTACGSATTIATTRKFPAPARSAGTLPLWAWRCGNARPRIDERRAGTDIGVIRGLDLRIHRSSKESRKEDGLPGQARQ